MKLFSVVLIALIFAISAPGLHAATVFADNFNAEHGGTGTLNYTGFSNWTVSGGAVDLIGNGSFDFYPGHGLYVDLDGTAFKAGLFSSSSLSLGTGTYTLQFALGGSQRGDTNTVQVTLGSAYSESFTLASGDALTLFTRTITVAGPTSASLTFQNDGGDNIGAILDDVKLDSVSTPTTVTDVPEPTSMVLMVLGLAGIGMVRRRAL